jgi:hypothetical protein
MYDPVSHVSVDGSGSSVSGEERIALHVFFPSTDEDRVILNSRNKRQEERFHYCIHSERFQFSCINYGSTLAEKIEFTVYCYFIVQIH